ncbi:MAG: hypothetical protein ABJG68_07620 [Crocinitomicaceae bacterium]
MKLNVLINVIFFLLLLSCKKDPTPIQAEPLNGEKSVLIGQWQWYLTEHEYGWCEGMTLYEELSPLSIGSSYQVNYYEEGTVVLIKDSIMLSEEILVFDYFNYNSENDFNFRAFLDGQEEKLIGGHIINDTMIMLRFPFTSEEGCENNKNYFSKL